MVVNEEWVYWSNERSSSAMQQGGMHPRVVRSQVPRMFTKLYYCYYQPKPPNKAFRVLTYLLYGVGGLIGLSMLASLLACIAKWLCRCKGLAKEADWSGLGQDFPDPQPVVVNSVGESPRIYKYITVRTTDGIIPSGKVGGPYGLGSLPEEGTAFPAVFADQISASGGHLYPAPAPLVPSAPSDWEDVSSSGTLTYDRDVLQSQMKQQQQQPIIATRVVLLKPTATTAAALYPDISLASISPHLPSYSDATSVQKAE